MAFANIIIVFILMNELKDMDLNWEEYENVKCEPHKFLFHLPNFIFSFW